MSVQAEKRESIWWVTILASDGTLIEASGCSPWTALEIAHLERRLHEGRLPQTSRVPF